MTTTLLLTTDRPTTAKLGSNQLPLPLPFPAQPQTQTQAARLDKTEAAPAPVPDPKRRGRQGGFVLKSHQPSPGSLRQFEQALARGLLEFNPESEIREFYRYMVEYRKNGTLRVKAEFTPTEVLVYPDSSIYGEIEPNLLFFCELLTAHYQVLNQLERTSLELHLVDGLSFAEIGRELGRTSRAISGYFTSALTKLREFVYEDGEQTTWQLPPRPALLTEREFERLVQAG